jgi:hypothetical protein
MAFSRHRGNDPCPPRTPTVISLFGVLALQLDFVSRDGWVFAAKASLMDNTRALGEFLVKQQGLTPCCRQVFFALDR